MYQRNGIFQTKNIKEPSAVLGVPTEKEEGRNPQQARLTSSLYLPITFMFLLPRGRRHVARILES